MARQAPQRDDDVPLLPPRMLLHVSAIPKLLASLGRRGLFRPGEAVPFLFQAAMQLVELDDKERPVVDFEELVLHWCVPWPSYRYGPAIVTRASHVAHAPPFAPHWQADMLLASLRRMEQWGNWDLRERNLASLHGQQAPKQRLRRPEHGKTREAIHVKY